MDEFRANVAAAEKRIQQVSLAVTGMDNVSQQNASLVEEASTAAASLEDQAGKLTQAVAAFRLRDSPAAAGVTARVSAPLKTPAHALRPALAGGNDNRETF